MAKNIKNSIIFGKNEINHLMLEVKSSNIYLHGASLFKFNIQTEDIKNLIESAILDISEIVHNQKLTNIVLAGDEVLKYLFLLDGVNLPDYRVEILNRFKNFFDITLSNYYVDYEIYDFDNHKVVFVAGILKSNLEKIIKPFRSNGFKLLSLETDINALKRLLGMYYKDDIVLGLYMRQNDSVLIIFKGNVLLSFRELAVGYENILTYLKDVKNESIDIIEQKLISKKY